MSNCQYQSLCSWESFANWAFSWFRVSLGSLLSLKTFSIEVTLYLSFKSFMSSMVFPSFSLTMRFPWANAGVFGCLSFIHGSSWVICSWITSLSSVLCPLSSVFCYLSSVSSTIALALVLPKSPNPKMSNPMSVNLIFTFVFFIFLTLSSLFYKVHSSLIT